MKTKHRITLFVKHVRWSIADCLAKTASRLRGHSVLHLGYDLYGNEAAEIEDDLLMRMVGGNRLTFERDELKTMQGRVARLASLARATWWHDPQRERAEREIASGQKGEE